MSTRVAQPEKPVLPASADLMRLASRPAPIIAHPAWCEARDKVLALVRAQTRLIAILGPAGCGKTSLLRELAETLPSDRPVTYFQEFSENSYEFPARGIVLADEAERLSSSFFDLLEERTDITLIVAALPSFHDRLQDYPDAAVVPLPLLTNDEAHALLAEWLAELGLPVNCLTAEAWARLITYCRGVPRLLASLLKLTLFVAAEEEAPRVVLEHVEVAIEVQGGKAATSAAEPTDPAADEAGDSKVDEAPARAASELVTPVVDADQPPRPRRRRSGWLSAGALCVAAIALLLVWDRQLNRHDIPPPARDRPAATSATASPTLAAPATPSPATVSPAPPATPSPASPATPSPASPATTTGPSEAKPAVAPAANQAAPAAPEQAPAPARINLPSGASIRVVVTYLRGDTAASQRSMVLTRTLRADGFAVSDPFPVATRGTKSGIRYYFVQDEDTAKAIADRLGDDYGPATLQPFSLRDGLPRPGTIEITVGHG